MFDLIYYINLDSQPQKNELFLKRAAAAGFENLIRIPGVIVEEIDYPFGVDETRKNKIGCTLAHQNVIKDAKNRNASSILIFEDDVVFVDNFKSKFEERKEQLEKLEWNLFYLGGEPNAKCNQVAKNLFSLKIAGQGVYGTHAYGVNANFFDKILSLDIHKIHIIDHALIHLDNRSYIVSDELLCSQDDNMISDIQGITYPKTIVYSKAWNDYVKKS